MHPLHVQSQGLWPLGEVDTILDVDSDYRYLLYLVMGNHTFLLQTIDTIRSTYELPLSATFCHDFFQNSTSLTQDKDLKVTNKISHLIYQHFDKANPASTTIKKNKEWAETVQSLFIIDNIQRFTMENIRELNFLFRMGGANCPQCSRKAALVFLFHTDPPPLTSELVPYDENKDGNIDFGELRSYLSKKFDYSDVQFNGDAFIGRMHNMAIQSFDTMDSALNASEGEGFSSSICSPFVVPPPNPVSSISIKSWQSIVVAVVLLLLPFVLMKMWPRKAPSVSVKNPPAQLQSIQERSELSSEDLQEKEESEPKATEMKEKEFNSSCVKKKEESDLKPAEEKEERDGLDTAESKIEVKQAIVSSADENQSHDLIPEEAQHAIEKVNEIDKEDVVHVVSTLPGSHEKKRKSKAETSEVPSHHYNLRSRKSP
eukprot:gene8241-9089_t